jgi:hypothetical protein
MNDVRIPCMPTVCGIVFRLSNDVSRYAPCTVCTDYQVCGKCGIICQMDGGGGRRLYTSYCCVQGNHGADGQSQAVKHLVQIVVLDSM